MASNRRWRGQFRYRGSRRESAVAQLFSLGIVHAYVAKLHIWDALEARGKDVL